MRRWEDDAMSESIGGPCPERLKPRSAGVRLQPPGLPPAPPGTGAPPPPLPAPVPQPDPGRFELEDCLNDLAVIRATFHQEVFQKFIAVMFAFYAARDPLFYNRRSRDD